MFSLVDMGVIPLLQLLRVSAETPMLQEGIARTNVRHGAIEQEPGRLPDNGQIEGALGTISSPANINVIGICG
jgi:hypothetical protein